MQSAVQKWPFQANSHSVDAAVIIRNKSLKTELHTEKAKREMDKNHMFLPNRVHKQALKEVSWGFLIAAVLHDYPSSCTEGESHMPIQ